MKKITLRTQSVVYRNGLVKASEEGTLDEYIGKHAISIERDDENDITHIVFTLGGPYIYLDFEDSPGVIIAKDMDDKSQAAIPFSIWSDIKTDLEEL